MAERVGFEPTYRLITDNSISSRARYGLFATFPQTCVLHEVPPAGKPFFLRRNDGFFAPCLFSTAFTLPQSGHGRRLGRTVLS